MLREKHQILNYSCNYMRKYFAEKKKIEKKYTKGDDIAYCRRGGCTMDNFLYFSFKCSILNMCVFLKVYWVSVCVWVSLYGQTEWEAWRMSFEFTDVHSPMCAYEEQLPCQQTLLCLWIWTQEASYHSLLSLLLVPPGKLAMSVLNSKLAPGPASEKTR